MEIYVAGTGSSGNCYVLKAGGEILLLDAGVPFKKFVREIDCPVVGCLVTHEHGDHSKYIKDVFSHGIDVYSSEGTFDKVGFQGGRVLSCGRIKTIGGFRIVPFETEHDAEEPFGYLIMCVSTGEKVVYATDTYYLKNTFPGVNYWLVESNYCENILDNELADGSITLDMRNRLKKSHMSLERLLDVLNANNISECRKIILCHLSDSRSSETYMVDAVHNLTGLDVCAAKNGDKIKMSLCGF